MLEFNKKVLIMGVLNVTPDSFSDGGKFFDKDRAVSRGVEMAREGADIIDIGGESTRPGSQGVSAEEEMKRVVPVIEELSKKVKVPLSIDTRKREVAENAVKAGASIINDVSGPKADPSMADVAAKYGTYLIIMHMKGEPADMQLNPAYDNLIKEIMNGLKESIVIAKKAGVKDDKVIIDPGIGFGKTLGHNLEILRRLEEFKVLKYPLCIGVSRKSFIGKILGSDNPADRLSGSLAAACIAAMKGAGILRVHDVKETVEAAAIVDGIVGKGRVA